MLLPITDLTSTDFQSGTLLLIDKPQAWTSFDVVNKVRGMLKRKYGMKDFKVGHSGTLDPMATGLLLLCTGKWTKELHQLQRLDKKYVATITLGIETDSYDAEGKVVATKDVPELSIDKLNEVLSKFKGEIDQHPPAFSAIKKDGKPLYKAARAGKEVKTEARKVIVYNIEIINYAAPHLELNVHCGSGFYVRSLAHDLGVVLGCGGHLSVLRRTEIGAYSVHNAFSIEMISDALGRV